MAEQNLGQIQSQRQEQILAPQQLQSLEVLLAPLLELQDRINQEIIRNPVLELAGDDDGGSDESNTTATASTDDDSSDDFAKDDTNIDIPYPSDSAPLHSAIPIGDITDDGENDHDGDMNEMLEFNDWEDYRNDYTAFSSQPDEQDKRDFMFNSIIEQPSLQEQLMEQLRLADAPAKVKDAAEELIGGTGDSGYLEIDLEELAREGKYRPETVNAALALIQSFDPPGICARSVQECLLIQIQRQNRPNRKLITLVKHHLEDVSRNHLPQIAKTMRISLEELNLLLDELKTLNPHPAAAITPSNPIFVVPEITVEADGDEFKIISNNEYLPHLRISSYYQRMLKDANTTLDEKNYLREKINNGKILIRSLEQRQSTIENIARVIVDSQHDFLRFGTEHLHPMTMQQVADKLGLHETTISRAIANKYIKTPSGILEFKFFFSGGYRAENGENLSSKSIQEKIHDLIQREDPAKPLSDSTLSDMLKKSGLTVARRTVAKYRENLGIQPSHLRKEHQ